MRKEMTKLKREGQWETMVWKHEELCPPVGANPGAEGLWIRSSGFSRKCWALSALLRCTEKGDKLQENVLLYSIGLAAICTALPAPPHGKSSLFPLSWLMALAELAHLHPGQDLGLNTARLVYQGAPGSSSTDKSTLKTKPQLPDTLIRKRR